MGDAVAHWAQEVVDNLIEFLSACLGHKNALQHNVVPWSAFAVDGIQPWKELRRVGRNDLSWCFRYFSIGGLCFRNEPVAALPDPFEDLVIAEKLERGSIAIKRLPVRGGNAPEFLGHRG